MINLEFIKEVGYRKYFYRTLQRQFYKKFLGQDQKIKLPNGNIMNLPKTSRCASEIFVTNCNVDWGSEQILIKHLEPQKAFLDIGANIGYYALLAADRVNQVYAFEPDARNLTLLNKNVRNYRNIEIIPQLVYSQVQEIHFDTGNCPEVSHIVAKNSQNPHTVKLTATTLNDFAENNQELSVTGIKIDVEGADFDVLLGGDRLIIRDNPLILAEFFQIEDKLFDYINNIKYEIFAFTKPLLLKETKNNRFAFNKITKDNKNNFRYKMIFLVPPRLQNIFLNYISEH